MIQSMTGYAGASTDTARGTLCIELRSVNARFLDLQFRNSDELRALEPLLREMLSARLARGKVDCRLFLGGETAVPVGASLNAEAIARLRELSAEVLKAMPQASPLHVADVLRWPSVIAQPAVGEDELRGIASSLCRKALDELVASRGREGAKLAAAVGERVAAMRQRLDDIAPRLPEALSAYQAKLSERLKEAVGSADDERVRTEVAVFAGKVDVDEELTRLRAHLGEVDETLKRGGAGSSPVGKRLDFIAQELNREANTLASKAASAEISDCGLELKLLVEQIREQVQNIE